MPDNFENKPNRLIHEKSPYLLQHAYNPVDWYPWSEEAFRRAHTEDKPILLSIGYSTCHWCHVMERESFSNPEIARLMNQNFVCIKLDREERPDLDQIYITAVSAIRGSAGWPLNVFLTPDLKPFYGGTYFPPRRRPGMASWPEILELLAKAWLDKGQREKIENSADAISQMIHRHLGGNPEASPMEVHLPESAYQAFVKRYDATMGGFSPAPKFPSPAIQAFLFFYHMVSDRSGNVAEKESGKALEMALHTLRSIARGGIFDHVGGGFHRYATDSRWHIPHFEKMLYDNAQLVLNYLMAFQITRDPFYRQVAEATLTYVDREMTHPQGGFYSAQDADSLPAHVKKGEKPDGSVEKREGAYYAWKHSEIVDILGGEDAQIVSDHYGILPAGNALDDPIGEFTGENILFQAHTIEETARRLKMGAESVRKILDAARIRLLAAREERPRPHLDDKIITAWNGLMISAWARAYQLLDQELYRIRAVAAAEFIWTHLYDEKKGSLFRIWRKGERRIPAMAEDYAAYIQGLIDTYEADFDVKWLHRAASLARILVDAFFDPINGGFFLNAANRQERFIPRIKETHDGVIPSAATLATLALLRLHQFTGTREFLQAAEATLQSFVPAIRQNPEAAPLMLTAAEYVNGRSLQIVIAGKPEEDETRRMLEVARTFPHPAKTLILVDGPRSRISLSEFLPFIAELPVLPEKPTAYLCVNQTCTAPMTDSEKLRIVLQEKQGG